MYSFTSRPARSSSVLHGPHSGLPRKIDPVSGTGSNGVSISIVPSFEESGHAAGAPVFNPTWTGEHAPKPSAADGEMDSPAGNVTTAFLTSAVAMPRGFSSPSCG